MESWPVPNVKVAQLKRGAVIKYEGDLCKVVEMNYRNPGNLNAFYQCKLRSLSKGNMLPVRFANHDTVDLQYLDTRTMQYLYKEGTGYVFMDAKTYEQTTIDADFLGDDALLLIENTDVQVTFHDDRPIGVELPTLVELEIEQTEGSARGDTVVNVFKDATCTTGYKVKVPMFINIGDKITIDTRTGEFSQRTFAKK